MFIAARIKKAQQSQKTGDEKTLIWDEHYIPAWSSYFYILQDCTHSHKQFAYSTVEFISHAFHVSAPSI